MNKVISYILLVAIFIGFAACGGVKRGFLRSAGLRPQRAYKAGQHVTRAGFGKRTAACGILQKSISVGDYGSVTL